ncbi:hypothetical protein GGI18_004658, partial [Coemansia linderi]
FLCRTLCLETAGRPGRLGGSWSRRQTSRGLSAATTALAQSGLCWAWPSLCLCLARCFNCST